MVRYSEELYLFKSLKDITILVNAEKLLVHRSLIPRQEDRFNFFRSDDNNSLRNSRHFAPLVSPRNDLREKSVEIPYLWRVTTQIWLLIGRASWEICSFSLRHRFARKLAVAPRNSELRLRRFWATHVNRKWTFCPLEPWFWPNFGANRLYKN